MLPYVPQVGVINPRFSMFDIQLLDKTAQSHNISRFLKGPSFSLTVWITVAPQDQLKDENRN